MHADGEQRQAILDCGSPVLSVAAHALQNGPSLRSSPVISDFSPNLRWYKGDGTAEKIQVQRVSLTTFSFCIFLFLTDPVFVGSAYIEESQPIGNPVGDDDKIYFFFSEAGKEFDFFDNTIVSRIARVCKVRHLGLGWGHYAGLPRKNEIPAGLEPPVLNPDTITSKQGGTLPCQSMFGNI